MAVPESLLLPLDLTLLSLFGFDQKEDLRSIIGWGGALLFGTLFMVQKERESLYSFSFLPAGSVKVNWLRCFKIAVWSGFPIAILTACYRMYNDSDLAFAILFLVPPILGGLILGKTSLLTIVSGGILGFFGGWAVGYLYAKQSLSLFIVPICAVYCFLFVLGAVGRKWLDEREDSGS